MKCLNVFKKFFHKHSFIIVNGFCTLSNMDEIDLIKVCSNCGKRETFLLDRDMLLEVIDLYPHAFDSVLLEYLKIWKGD